MVVRLARATGAKVLMVEQRLAPQNPFPAALLDIFQAYLTLINPPPGSPHEAVPPSSIVVAGDSSGGCLALGLLQVLLQLQRKEIQVNFHGSTIDFSSKSPLVPAGMALLSPIAEIAGGLESFDRNAFCDIFPVPIEKVPYLEDKYPTCHIWPTSPPRANIYCEAGMLAHPLVSPALSADWAGSCPIWMGMGQEQAQDCSRLIAQEAHRAGVSVTLREYECMVHAFFLIFRTAPQSKQILAMWTQAIMQFGTGKQPPSSACFVRARGLKEEALPMDKLVDVSLEEAQKLAWDKTHAYKVPPFHQAGKRSNL